MQPLHEHKNLFAATLFLMFLCFMVFSSCSKESFKDENNCDLSSLSYQNGMKKIIDNNCAYTGCHSNNDETFDFSTYDGVKTSAGSIVNRINRDVDDPLFMPQNKYQLDKCDLQKLRTWVSIGAPLK